MLRIKERIRTSWYDYGKRRIVRELSENSRASVSQLSKVARCSMKTAEEDRIALERDFVARYTLEFSERALGSMTREIMAISFKTKPGRDELKKIFSKGSASLLAMMEGDYDLLAIIPIDGKRYMELRSEILSKLQKYGPTMRSALILGDQVGFIPLQRSEIGRLDIAKFGLKEEDREVIAILNENSRETYAEIGRKLHLGDGEAKQRISRINSSGIIRRYTMVLKNPPTLKNIGLFIDTESGVLPLDTRERLVDYYSRLDQRLPLINNFQYASIVSGKPFALFVTGCFESDRKYNEWGVEAHRDMFKEHFPVVTQARFAEILDGTLPVRNIDIGSYKG